ncbi:hypothetical protein MTO96_043527 [Rhipicephalus appendiculatus]
MVLLDEKGVLWTCLTSEDILRDFFATRVEGPVSSVGDGGILADATEGLVRRCIVDTISSRVAPVLADVLRTIPFPTFANEQE